MSSTTSPHPIHAAERAAAARARSAARKLLLSRTVLVVAAATLALGTTLFGLGVILRGDLRGLLWILFFGTPAAWALVKLLPRHRPLPDVETLGPGEHPELQAWIRGVADRLGVPPPAAVHLQPSASLGWVHFGEPAVLAVGIGWLGWLRQPEMERTLAARLTWLRCLDDRTVAKAVAFLERVDLDSLSRNEAPIIGILIRRIGRALDTHATALGLCMQDWVDLATPPELSVDESTEVESEIAAIGWEILVERWVVPMRRMKLDPRSLVDEHFRILVDFRNDLIERHLARREGPTGASLLDLRTADHVVTARTFADVDESSNEKPHEVIEWADYVQRVVVPTHRTIAATGIATATRLTGAPAPATLGAWVALAQSGWLPAIGAAMAADPANWGWLAAHVDPLVEHHAPITPPGKQGAPQPPQPNPAGQVERVDGPPSPQELVAWTITSMFELALTDKGLASFVRSSGHGVALLDESGTPLPLVDEIERIAAAQDAAALSSLVALAELDPDEPVWLGDNADVEPDREIIGVLAYRRWLPHDAVFTSEAVELHRARRGQFWRDTIARMTGSRKERADLNDRLAEVLKSRRAPVARVAYADVIDARIVSHGVSMSQWKLTLRTADGKLAFIGMSGGADVPRLLRSYLGSRLATAGFARKRPAWMRWVTYVCWALIALGGVVVIAGLYGLVDPDFGSSDIQTRGQVLTQILLPGIVIVALGYVPHWLMNRRVERSS